MLILFLHVNFGITIFSIVDGINLTSGSLFNDSSVSLLFKAYRSNVLYHFVLSKSVLSCKNN